MEEHTLIAGWNNEHYKRQIQITDFWNYKLLEVWMKYIFWKTNLPYLRRQMVLNNMQGFASEKFEHIQMI